MAPPEVVEIGGWRVPFDDGPIGRAKSAVPLRHDLGPEALDEIEAAFRARGLPPRFRIADVPSLGAVAADLARRGYSATQADHLQDRRLERRHGAPFADGPAMLLSEPSDGLGCGFPGRRFRSQADGAPSACAALTRSPDAVYGAAGEGAEIQAVGVMSFGAGWAGVHGMRTAPAHRGKGLASRILATLEGPSRRQARGVTRVFLQVEEPNPAAPHLPRRRLSPTPGAITTGAD